MVGLICFFIGVLSSFEFCFFGNLYTASGTTFLVRRLTQCQHLFSQFFSGRQNRFYKKGVRTCRARLALRTLGTETSDSNIRTAFFGRRHFVALTGSLSNRQPIAEGNRAKSLASSCLTSSSGRGALSLGRSWPGTGVNSGWRLRH